MPRKCKKPAESLRFHGFRCLISNCCFLLQSNLCLRNYLAFSMHVLAKCKLKKAGESTSAHNYASGSWPIGHSGREKHDERPTTAAAGQKGGTDSHNSCKLVASYCFSILSYSHQPS